MLIKDFPVGGETVRCYINGKEIVGVEFFHRTNNDFVLGLWRLTYYKLESELSKPFCFEVHYGDTHTYPKTTTKLKYKACDVTKTVEDTTLSNINTTLLTKVYFKYTRITVSEENDAATETTGLKL